MCEPTPPPPSLKRTLPLPNSHTHPNSYLVPLVLRNTVYRRRFVPGPFSLGRASGAVNALAVAWVAFAVVLFAIPQVYPVTGVNLNYAPVAVGLTLAIAAAWWALDARRWFKGPRGGWGADGDDAVAELAADGDGGSGGGKDVAAVAAATAAADAKDVTR